MVVPWCKRNEALQPYRFQDLHERWRKLVGYQNQFGGWNANPDAWWKLQDICDRYAHESRYYHSPRHIRHCLQEFDTAKILSRNPTAVEIAIFGHDVIYDTRRQDNEEQSAVFMGNLLRELGKGEPLIQEVSELILVTRHAGNLRGIDQMLIADADLAILGQMPEVFDEYERDIRSEYGWIPDIEFKTGRRTIIESFLKKESVYITQHFRERYENQARKNLRRSISALL